jgi:hypothetical protein
MKPPAVGQREVAALRANSRISQMNVRLDYNSYKKYFELIHAYAGKWLFDAQPHRDFPRKP